MKVDKDLKSEELDRRLTFEKSTGSIYDVVEAVVNNKQISFTTVHHQVKNSSGHYSNGDHIHKTRIFFKKLNSAHDDNIEIEVHNFMKKHRTEKCNLGHVHNESSYDWNEWQRLILTWEQMEQLIEWFQIGRFYDPRTRQAKKRGAKNGFHSEKREK